MNYNNLEIINEKKNRRGSMRATLLPLAIILTMTGRAAVSMMPRGVLRPEYCLWGVSYFYYPTSCIYFSWQERCIATGILPTPNTPLSSIPMGIVVKPMGIVVKPTWWSPPGGYSGSYLLWSWRCRSSRWQSRHSPRARPTSPPRGSHRWSSRPRAGPAQTGSQGLQKGKLLD